MGLRALLRNLSKLVLMGLGGVLGALVVIWARANSDWVTVRIPSIIVPGGGGELEYEAQIYAIVALSFVAGVVSCVWIALAVWLRAFRRERRLAQSLEQLEEQVSETRGLHFTNLEKKALPASQDVLTEAHFDDFDELDTETEALLSGAARLPEGYDDSPSQEVLLTGEDSTEEGNADREKTEKVQSGRGEETVA